VSYYIDSIAIVEGGTACLTSIEGGRAAFVFVLGKTIQALKTLSALKLTELTETSATLPRWYDSIAYNDISTGILWANWFNYTSEDRSADAGHVDLPQAVTHPTVTLWWLLGAIASKTSIGLADLASITEMVYTGFPLRNKDGISAVGGSYDIFPEIDSIADDFVWFKDNAVTGHVEYINPVVDIFHDFRIKADVVGNVNVTVSIVLPTEIEANSNQLELYRNGVLVKSVSYTDETTYHKYTMLYTLVGLVESDTFYFKLVDRTISTLGALSSSFTIGSVSAYYGGIFPVVPNLPDMNAADFVTECAQLVGMFPYVDPATPSVLNFYSASILYDNLLVTRNWTRLLNKTTQDMDQGENITFALDGFAQRNRVDYKEDETNQLDTSGIVTVNNTNIEKEMEMFRMKFAAAKRSASKFKIIDYPLYDAKIVAGNLIRNFKQQDIDVLAYAEIIGTDYYLTFPDAMKFSQRILSTDYGFYRSLVLQPRIIKERFQLNRTELSKMDVRVPVYLQQYGKYYAILEAQVTDEYEADVTLLELKLL
jgi:hypothetical protein